MNKKIKPEINEKKLGFNPFMTNITLKGRMLDKEENIIIQSDKGVGVPVGTFKSTIVIEEQSFTKIWHDTDFRNIILKLDEVSLKLFIFIQYQLEPNKDYIWINSRLFQDTACVKHKSEYIEAMEKLVRYSIVTTTIYPDVYWINPLILFSGNRLKKYPDNLKLR